MSRRGRLLPAAFCALAGFIAGSAHAAPPMKTEPFAFVADGNRLRGVIDRPAGGAPRAVLLFVHGYGRTDVVAQNWYYDLRSRFTDLGLATVVWDKPGCGKSEGSFDIHQPVESSAREVVAAVRQIREKTLPGVTKIGLWGISRAGWIAPLAMAQDRGIGFWISVSGTDDQENFPYFIESNFRIEGRSEAEIRHLMSEWRRGFDLTSRGGSFEAYLDATKALRHDPFMIFLAGNPEPDQAAFLEEQRRFRAGEFKVDGETGLMIYVPGFRELLGRLDMPVLALFGEKDRNVDWRKTRALYSETIGRNPKARLTVKTFPDGNHNLHQSRTGGYREMLEILKSPVMSDGYYETMLEWLRTQVLESRLIRTTASDSLAQPSARTLAATTPHFAFYSDFATNLNDALIAAGAARRATKTELFQSGAEKACFGELPAAERAAWSRAVDYYAEIVSPARFNAPVQFLPRLELAGVVKKEALTDAAERRFLDITSGFRAAAAPAYERCRWSSQDAANRRWIEGLLPLLAAYGPTLAQRLPELYGTPWAGMPFRVDVVETVSFAGADSVQLRDPGLHILVSSSNPANQGPAALEIVFHEACHFLTGFNTPLRAALGAAVRDTGATVSGDLTHPVHFFMTGEAVRRVLERPGEPPYTPYLYAHSLFSPEFRDAVKKSWPAYMDGKRTLQEAAADLIRALGK